jgi:hypothetical protein
VASGRDRQEFSNPLNNGQQDGLENAHAFWGAK